MAIKVHPVIQWVVSLGLLAALVVWVERTVGWGPVLAAWQRIPLRDIGAVVLLTLTGYIARAARISFHFGGDVLKDPLLCFRVMALHNVANNFLPMRTGELSFPLLLKRDFGVSRARSLAALLWLRALDLSAIVVAAGLSLGIDQLGTTVGVLIAVLGLGLPSMGYLVLTIRRTEGQSLLARLASGLPVSGRSLASGQALTLVQWGAKLAAYAWILADIGGIDRVHAWTGAVAGELTSVLPIHGIAGAGTYEGGIVLVLSPLGVPMENALTAATDLHLFMLGFSLVAGAASAAFIRR
jgi:hypothetical protein